MGVPSDGRRNPQVTVCRERHEDHVFKVEHLKLYSDSSAARGSIGRFGVSKRAKHICTKNLLEQNLIDAGIVTALSVPTLINVADLFTKHFTGERVHFLLGLMGAYIVPAANGDRTESQEGTAAESSLVCLVISTTIALVLAMWYIL